MHPSQGCTCAIVPATWVQKSAPNRGDAGAEQCHMHSHKAGGNTMDAPTLTPLMPAETRRVHILKQLERKLLWLSAWMVHNANHIRPNRDGLKVGGHQASCASVISIMTALYFEILKPSDRIAVKRRFGGIQSYPSKAKDGPEVDFSTGSVGLGVALTSFTSLMQD